MLVTIRQITISVLILTHLITTRAQLNKSMNKRSMNKRSKDKTKKWSFLAELDCSIERDWFDPLCFGALIHGRWVLTTAKCVSDAPCRKVYLNLFGNKEDELTVTASFQQKHRNYKLINRTGSITTIGKDYNVYPLNDIGLVRLDRYVVIKCYNIMLSKKPFIPDNNCNTVRRKTTKPEPLLDFEPCEVIKEIYHDASHKICKKITTRIITDHPISFRYENINYGAPLLCSGVLFGFFSESVALGDVNITLSKYRMVWMLTGYYIEWIENVLNAYGDSLDDFVPEDVMKANEPTGRTDSKENIFIVTNSKSVFLNGHAYVVVIVWLLRINFL